MKILIGISSPRNALTQAAIAILTSLLNLKHINMRQPMVNMLAGLLGRQSSEIQFDIPSETKIKGLSTTLAELEVMLAFNLRTLNANYFIEQAKTHIELANSGINLQLFDGQIITGISTELEAQWIRDQGGLMVHIYDYTPQNLAKFDALNEKQNDLVIMTSNQCPITESNVYKTVEDIRSLFTTQREAA